MQRDIRTLIARAMIALEQGDTKLAKSLSDEALRSDPKDDRSLELRVRVALAMHDGKLALATAEQLVSLDPKSLDAILTRITTYLSLNMDEKARPALAQVAREYSILAIVQYYRAVLLARSNRVVDAWKIAMVLPSEFNKSDPSIAKNVAQIAAASGHLDPAGAILKASLDKWPHDHDLRLGLALIRLKEKNPTDALNVLYPLQDSKDPRAQMLFAQAYTALGRPDDARRYLPDDARRYFDSAKGGGDTVTLTTSPQKALKVLSDWVQSHPKDIDARREYAELLLDLGDKVNSQMQYELVLEALPNDIVALNNLGWLLQKSDPHRAMALVTIAAERAPNTPNVLDTEGWIAFQQDNKKLALDALSRAHTQSPDDAGIAYHLALVLDSLGRRADAKTLLQSVLTKSKTEFPGRVEAERLLASMR
jgi:Tfp pilus assembly protein PilF